MSPYIPSAPPDIYPALCGGVPYLTRLSPIPEKPETAETAETPRELSPPSMTLSLPAESFPNLAEEEALYRVWWRTLPDKPLARACGGDLAHWQRERGLSAAALAGLRTRVRDLLEGTGK